MTKIFVGMLLVFLNFNFNINHITIGLIPSFLGYIVMLLGLRELAQLSGWFSKAQPCALAMAVYTTGTYLMDLFGVSAWLGFFGIGLGLISTVVSLVIGYMIVMGIKEAQTARQQSLNADQLYFTWKVYAIASLAAFGLALVPFIALVGAIVSFAAAVYFLVIFNKTRRLFDGQDTNAN